MCSPIGNRVNPKFGANKTMQSLLDDFDFTVDDIEEAIDDIGEILPVVMMTSLQ